MKDIFIKYKDYFIIASFFLFSRMIVFLTFWKVSLAKGGWNNFYAFAQPAPYIFLKNFHDLCDWHPPLYYFFTSVILAVFNSHLFIYLFQVIFSLAACFFAYKLGRLFFNHKISLFSAIFFAIEPFWAWHNFLLVSENASLPLFIAGLYYFFLLIRTGFVRYSFWAGLLLGLATLTRSNTLFVSLILSLLVAGAYWLDKNKTFRFDLINNFKKLLISLLLFNVFFFSAIVPWMAHNKIVYGNFTLANMLYTNLYFYNLPPLLSYQKGISYDEALNSVKADASQSLGPNVGDQGDCRKFSKENFSRQLQYFDQTAKRTIISNFWPYARLHLIKMTPFFLQSGYSDLVSAYLSEYKKPDLTSSVLSGDWLTIKNFFFQINALLIIYLFGLGLWGLISASLLISTIYSFVKKKPEFLFFVIALIIILYSAFIISPFVLARYRLPTYPLFFMAFSYLLYKIYERIIKK